ncbi:MAG: PIN domain-containing protein [Acidobacteriota bacterium]|nr:PIN domain-containing protein [Acidobacteriota bacterium]
MIYLDSSVALAQILGEDQRPPPALWTERATASRLLEYEIWVTLNSRGFAETHTTTARDLIGGVSLLELSRSVLARAHGPFPAPLRTLDALHLATVDHLHRNGEPVRLATYDGRMATIARAMGFPLYDLGN